MNEKASETLVLILEDMQALIEYALPDGQGWRGEALERISNNIRKLEEELTEELND